MIYNISVKNIDRAQRKKGLNNEACHSFPLFIRFLSLKFARIQKFRKNGKGGRCNIKNNEIKT